MKKELILISLVSMLTLSSTNSWASIPQATIKDVLLQKYMSNYESKAQLESLKKETLQNGGKSVDALIEVMKNGKYPDKNRWVATFMLGQIMGSKSAPFIVKFLRHPSWVMRMASLKTLLALKQDRYSNQYAMLLSDDSLLVREQALENIKMFKANSYAPQVWAMLYDKKNYYQPTLNGKPLKFKRTNLIKSIILTVGELKFQEARDPLFKMIQKERYVDIFSEMDQALSNITGKKSPAKADLKIKRLFWQRAALDRNI
jgi:HEAT repeat protein